MLHKLIFLFSLSGNEYPAIVEFAPFQRIPKLRSNRKKDPRAGTIENDPYYLDFVEALKAEEAQRKSASKTNKQHFFETTSAYSINLFLLFFSLNKHVWAY